MNNKLKGIGGWERSKGVRETKIRGERGDAW
jgi:hypothetical protein